MAEWNNDGGLLVDTSVQIGAGDLAALDRGCAISRRTGGVVV